MEMTDECYHSIDYRLNFCIAMALTIVILMQ